MYWTLIDRKVGLPVKRRINMLVYSHVTQLKIPSSSPPNRTEFLSSFCIIKHNVYWKTIVNKVVYLPKAKQECIDFRHRVNFYFVAVKHNVYNIFRVGVHLMYICAVFGSQLTFTLRQLNLGRCEYGRIGRELRYDNQVSCVSL